VLFVVFLNDRKGQALSAHINSRVNLAPLF